MNDPFFVRRRQPVRYLHGIVQSLASSNRSAAQPVPQRLALQQFRNDVRRAPRCVPISNTARMLG